MTSARASGHPTEPDPRSTSDPVLELSGVSVGYDDKLVVRDVSLTVTAGASVALLGTNGSGKSTLVKGILGLAQVRGSVRLFGQPASDSTRARVGYVPQRFAPSGPIAASVREVVLTGRLGSRRWFLRPSRADRAAVTEAIELVGLADQARSSVTELSGGQHRRVLIARALASHPDLLIMDEPTAGVDSSQQRALVHTLQRLTAQGVTLLIVTHELDALRSVLTRALVLREGRLVYDGALRAGLADHDHGEHHVDEQPPGAQMLPPLDVSPVVRP